jgi:hypothetical protein
MNSKRRTTPNLYLLYERSVQRAKEQVKFLDESFESETGKKAILLREDFCGTFWISTEWIKADPRHRAIALDLDAKPLNYGRKTHLKPLSAEQKSRLEIYKKNVLTPPKKKVDLICACNFSFFSLKTEALLFKYFKAAHDSLTTNGGLMLEMAGGAGFIETGIESKAIRSRELNFRYYWEQKSYDPITQEGHYAIHFKMKDGEKIQNAFQYDWRIWTIKEIKFLMKLAGFRRSVVYWEASDPSGEGTGEYVAMENGDNAHSWMCYVMGIK